MPSDSNGIQVNGNVLDQSNLFELPGPSVFVGGEQHDVAAGVSFGSSMCAQHQHQFDFV
eukprot:SAG31_NODE_284_length_18497_cov_11.811773_14_plen_59_part_00